MSFMAESAGAAEEGDSGNDDLPWFEAGEAEGREFEDAGVQDEAEPAVPGGEAKNATAEEPDRQAVPHDPSGGATSDHGSNLGGGMRPIRFDHETLDLFGD